MRKTNSLSHNWTQDGRNTNYKNNIFYELGKFLSYLNQWLKWLHLSQESATSKEEVVWRVNTNNCVNKKKMDARWISRSSNFYKFMHQ